MESTKLGQRAEVVLDAIKRCGQEWVKRTDIAKELGKKSLNSGDLILLQYLAEQGLIEAVSVPTNAPSGQRIEYKAVQR